MYIYCCWKSPNSSHFSTIIEIIRACACWALFVVTLTNAVHLICIYMYIFVYCIITRRSKGDASCVEGRYGDFSTQSIAWLLITWRCYKSRHQWHDDVIKWKIFPHYWPFVRGIHRSPVNSQQKGQWRGALIFSLICVWWINGWVNNREAGDLRRYRAHYDVTVMNVAWVNTEKTDPGHPWQYWWLGTHMEPAHRYRKYGIR